MCRVTVACRIYARLIELRCPVWLSASKRTRVSMFEGAKIPAELLVLVSLYLEGREMLSGDGHQSL